jgi:hypothetical protein
MGVPRILLLPGFTQNSVIFSGRIGALRRTLKDSAELVFVDPVRPSLSFHHWLHSPTLLQTHIVEVPTDAGDKFDSDATTAPTSAADTPRAWWTADTGDDGQYRKYKGFDETLHVR